MKNLIIFEGYVAKIYGVSQSGKKEKISVAWNRQRDDKKETVFMPVWFWKNDIEVHIGDRVLIAGELQQSTVEDGTHRTYISGNLYIIETKARREQRKALEGNQEAEIPGIPKEDELPF